MKYQKATGQCLAAIAVLQAVAILGFIGAFQFFGEGDSLRGWLAVGALIAGVIGALIVGDRIMSIAALADVYDMQLDRQVNFACRQADAIIDRDK